ncbi:IclR family transcriptional regulator [Microbaculum marinum]|uniref:IclR family transcriptional regulator n=2 Tax=Microbaculum marinum TaxID=1764581 RepID=A0AAW9REY2_9HYPH
MPPVPQKEPTQQDRKFVVALARGLDVLRAFRSAEGMLGNNEIAERTGLPKPTVSRLTYTLTRLGYLTHVPRFSKYRLAPGVLALGYTALAHLGIRQVARPFMQDLANHADASVALGAPDRTRVIYVEHCFSRSVLTVRLDVGSRIPIATTAAGRALIAVMSDEQRDATYRILAERAGAGWPKMLEGIETAIAGYEARGFTMSIGDWQPDVNGVAVPIVMPDGTGMFAFNCGAPAFSISPERLLEDIGPRLKGIVRKVSAILNGGENEPGEDLNEARNYQGGNVVNTGGGGRAGRRFTA